MILSITNFYLILIMKSKCKTIPSASETLKIHLKTKILYVERCKINSYFRTVCILE